MLQGLAGLSTLTLIGCATRQVAHNGVTRPNPWEETTSLRVQDPGPYGTTVQPTPSPTRQVPQGLSFGGVPILARSSWSTTGPIASRVNPMNGVNRVTVHHEGSTPFWATDQAGSAARVEQVRRAHVNGNGWGDIGYHVVIDRAGRAWEGRSLSSQGAHVSQTNEHNIGVMLLGNFQEQSPSQQQLASLAAVLQGMKATYRVPRGRFYTHRELKPTQCPGRNLQPSVDAIRTRYL